MRLFQCSAVIGSPVRRSQARSGSPRASATPVYQAVPSGSSRLRTSTTWAVKASSDSSARLQSIHVVGLSWQ